MCVTNFTEIGRQDTNITVYVSWSAVSQYTCSDNTVYHSPSAGDIKAAFCKKISKFLGLLGCIRILWSWHLGLTVSVFFSNSWILSVMDDSILENVEVSFKVSYYLILMFCFSSEVVQCDNNIAF